LNTAVTKANGKEILPLATKAAEWEVDISYSAYTVLRTRNEDYSLSAAEDLAISRQTINELVILKRRDTCITNPKLTLRNALEFFEQGGLPNCRAGVRFLVVMLGGILVPCSLQCTKYVTR
jgi:hypothetical protein